jgi:hypothetical protein
MIEKEKSRPVCQRIFGQAWDWLKNQPTSGLKLSPNGIHHHLSSTALSSEAFEAERRPV